MSEVTVTIIDGRPRGYINVEELAKKTGITPGAIRMRILRGKLHPLTIGYDKQKVHWFPETVVLEKGPMGRPKENRKESKCNT